MRGHFETDFLNIKVVLLVYIIQNTTEAEKFAWNALLSDGIGA